MTTEQELNLDHSRPNRVDHKAYGSGLKEAIDWFFSRHKPRGKQKYSDEEVKSVRRHFEIVLCDLYAALFSDPSLWIGYSRSKRAFVPGGRYWDFQLNGPTISQTFFLRVIDELAEGEWIENIKAASGGEGRSSRMRATRMLRDLSYDFKIKWSDISTDLAASVIIVKDKNGKSQPFPDTNGFDLGSAISNLNRLNANLDWSLLNLNISDEDFLAIQSKGRTPTQAADQDEGC